MQPLFFMHGILSGQAGMTAARDGYSPRDGASLSSHFIAVMR